MSIGLYIHIPFCIKKCNYCDFVSRPYDAELSASYVYALEREMALHSAALTEARQEVSTIYLGGGTPTCLDADRLTYILGSCQRHFKVLDGAEITLECNPGTVDLNKLVQLRRSGFNRISIGVQACQEKHLSCLGRIHNWQDIVKVSKDVRQAGFENVSFDLMFGIPGQTLEEWTESLQLVTDLKPDHISAYNLKYEEGTPMYDHISAGRLEPCDEDIEVDMYMKTMDFLAERGLYQYEISNFAVQGRESRHNILYWRDGEYLGLGAAAHSMMNSCRFSNIESVELYIKTIENGNTAVSEKQFLSLEEKVSEALFLGLRMNEGIHLGEFFIKYGIDVRVKYASQIGNLIEKKLLKIQGEHMRLTRKGLPLANEVFVEFI